MEVTLLATACILCVMALMDHWQNKRHLGASSHRSSLKALYHYRSKNISKHQPHIPSPVCKIFYYAARPESQKHRVIVQNVYFHSFLASSIHIIHPRQRLTTITVQPLRRYPPSCHRYRHQHLFPEFTPPPSPFHHARFSISKPCGSTDGMLSKFVSPR